MKLLLVSENEELRGLLAFHLRPVGVDIVRYLQPVKAMDNIDEVDPELVLFSAADFPRHWKPFVKLLRERKSREECVIVLLRGPVFPFEEAAKAQFLGVNGVVEENLADPRVFSILEEILLRYGLIKEGRVTRRYIPHEYDEIEFILTHPDTLQLVTGHLSDVSLTGVCFVPEVPSMISGLPDGAAIPTCSLKIGGEFLSISARVVRNGNALALQFTRLPAESAEVITKYLDQRSARALDHLRESVG